MWCSACGKNVKWREGIITGKDGKKYNVYIHKTKHHAFEVDKVLIDLRY